LFYVKIQESSLYKSGSQVLISFKLGQHSRDVQLIKSLKEYLACGECYLRSDQKLVEFFCTKFSDIDEKIIPFFEKYPLKGVKALDYADFCKVAGLMKNKAHLIVSCPLFFFSLNYKDIYIYLYIYYYLF